MTHATPTEPARTPQPHAMTGRVLIVDDDPEILTFLVTLLELEGLEPAVATSAQAALEQLQRGQPSLVLLDIAMPGQDGIELCKALKKDPRTREVPVFVISARPGREVVERALAAGAEVFIRKPFENHELIERIRARLA
jgi:CheY-like chemotaxis protein